MIEFGDIQVAAAALPDVEFEYRQLQAGQISIGVRVSEIEALSVTHVQVDRLAEGAGQVLPGRVVFLLCNHSPSPHLFDNQQVRKDEVYITRGGRLSESVLRAGFSGTLFNLPEESLRRLLRSDSAMLKADGQVVSLPAEVRKALSWLEREAKAAPIDQHRHLSETMTRWLCRSLRMDFVEDYPRRLDTRTHLARAIRDRLEDGQTLTLGDICFQLSICERTLRRVFSETYGVSPAQYHLAVRLNRVRDELKRRSPIRGTIGEVASREGFWHMGRFGFQYRRLFGETPQTTLISFRA